MQKKREIFGEMFTDTKRERHRHRCRERERERERARKRVFVCVRGCACLSVSLQHYARNNKNIYNMLFLIVIVSWKVISA